MQSVTIIMYHYVRRLKNSRYPGIKGLSISKFKDQVRYLKENYSIISVEKCIEAVANPSYSLPSKATLLTFDDGYKEHFTHVFPVLNRMGIPGAFFPVVQSAVEQKVLDINKIHFVLAAADKPEKLVNEVNDKLNEIAAQYNLEDPSVYWEKLNVSEHRYDPPEIVYIKRLLQRALPNDPRKLILNRLFEKYIGVSEATFARELYMNMEQLKCMHRNGMYIGGHSQTHRWLDTLNKEEQEKEIRKTKAFLSAVGTITKQWAMCYPFGAYNDQLIETLKKYNCGLGITTEVGQAKLASNTAFTLRRYDTNDLQNLIEGKPSVIPEINAKK